MGGQLDDYMDRAEEIGWKHVATVLYNELKRWGWGDFHYGSQPQEKSVVTALSVYEQALEGRFGGS
jgi:hypothetical protein